MPVDVTFSFLPKEKVTKKKSRGLVLFYERFRQFRATATRRLPMPHEDGNGGLGAAVIQAASAGTAPLFDYLHSGFPDSKRLLGEAGQNMVALRVRKGIQIVAEAGA